MPLIKSATTKTATTTATATAEARTVMNTKATTTANNGATQMSTSAAAATAATTATRTTSGKVRTTLTKSVPATPVQPKSPTTHFISTSPECDGGGGAAAATGEEGDNDEQEEEEHYNNCSEYLPHSYPNFTFDLSDDDSNEFDDELELDDSSLAMITPPPPYVDTPLQFVRSHGPPLPPPYAQRTGRAATAPPPPTRKKLFQNREIFNINTPTTTHTPSSNSFASAITPTKLSAAAAAMFAAPQMAQLNKKWTQLHRKRRRRNSSSGDSKELDKLVLQSVDWDENDIY